MIQTKYFYQTLTKDPFYFCSRKKTNSINSRCWTIQHGTGLLNAHFSHFLQQWFQAPMHCQNQPYWPWRYCQMRCGLQRQRHVGSYFHNWSHSMAHNAVKEPLLVTVSASILPRTWITLHTLMIQNKDGCPDVRLVIAFWRAAMLETMQSPHLH